MALCVRACGGFAVLRLADLVQLPTVQVPREDLGAHCKNHISICVFSENAPVHMINSLNMQQRL